MLLAHKHTFVGSIQECAYVMYPPQKQYGKHTFQYLFDLYTYAEHKLWIPFEKFL